MYVPTVSPNDNAVVPMSITLEQRQFVGHCQADGRTPLGGVRLCSSAVLSSAVACRQQSVGCSETMVEVMQTETRQGSGRKTKRGNLRACTAGNF